MKRFTASLGLAAAALAGLATNAHAGDGPPDVAYAVGSNVPGGSHIYRIDNFATAPVATVISSPGFVLSDIGINPANGDSYVVDALGNLYGLDRGNGALSLIGNTGVTGLNSLDVGPNGVIYARSWNSANVWTVSPLTAAANVLLDTEFSGGSDIAVSPDGLELWATADTGSGIGTGLIRVNLNTLGVDVIGLFGTNAGLPGLDFDSQGGLWGFMGGDSSPLAEVLSVNQLSGSASMVGTIAGAETLGLFGAAIVPEPASLSLLAVAGLVALRRRS